MKKEAWVIAADMGYGHQRAAYPLKDIAFERIINANSDKMISKSEQKVWKKARSFYEWISRIINWPIIGKPIFRLYNKLQKIDPYYPIKPYTKPGYQERYLEKKIKKGLCKSLINYIKKKDIPFVTTYYIPAIAANYYKLPKTYCVITDSDINRIWVPSKPETNIITYLAPCQHAVNRLLSYGVNPNQIILSGFPLPKECIGKNSEITKRNLVKRLINLDPNKLFLKPHIESIKSQLDERFDINKKPERLTITFVVGGAGAQKELGVEILKSLKRKLEDGKIRLILVAGMRLDIKQHFEDEIIKLGLKKRINKNITILAELTKKEYFTKFNQILNETDILWTKPSELSFYSALGIPIILAPPIGAQEGWNKKWLFETGGGFDQDDPKYTSEWIEEWLSDGRLASKAWQGFINAPRMGTYEIEKILFSKEK